MVCLLLTLVVFLVQNVELETWCGVSAADGSKREFPSQIFQALAGSRGGPGRPSGRRA